MEQEEFEARIKELEDYARNHPGSYRLRVGLLAALGYAYIVLVLVILIALLWFLANFALFHRANALVIKLGWLLLVFAAFIARSLWVQFPAPEGLELRREDAPRLFGVAEEIGAALQAPQSHHILLTEDFNAAIVQVPRLGVLGWQRNYLIVGLPLMLALSPQQFRAVLAHEMGHLSGNHGRFAGWIYRVRMTWIQLLERLQNETHWGSFVFHRFVNWYAPYFNAYSFVLARTQEYEADRNAAEVAGAQAASEALINLEVKGKFLEQKFWPDVYKQADQKADPPASTFTRMFHELRVATMPSDATQWIIEALSEKTSYDDTHPRLSERLRALGSPSPAPVAGTQDVTDASPVILPAPHDENAAQHFLGEGAKNLIVRLDAMWKENISPQWHERHEYARKSQRGLQELEEKAQREPLTAEETWNRARWTVEFKSHEAAIPLLREILITEPDHVGANYVLGELLLGQNDGTGIEHLERAMAHESDLVLPGCELIYFFLKRQERTDEAERYRERATEHYHMLVNAQQERQYATDADTFQPHGLSPAEVEGLRHQLSRYERIGEAYLVQKVVAHLPEKPFYVLGIISRHAWYEIDTSNKDLALIRQLAGELEFPGYFYVINLGANQKKLKELLSDIAGARLYLQEDRDAR